MTHQINRRRALTVVAAVPAAVAFSGSAFATGELGEWPSELAALIRRYWAEVDEFNSAHHQTDEESDAHAAATFEITQDAMIVTPARTAEDALAALDLIVREGEWNVIEFDNSAAPYGALLLAVRNYIKGGMTLPRRL